MRDTHENALALIQKIGVKLSSEERELVEKPLLKVFAISPHCITRIIFS